LNQEKTHAVIRLICPDYGAAGGSTELPALALPRSGSRVCGCPHSQRCALPCRMWSCAPTLTPIGRRRTRSPGRGRSRRPRGRPPSYARATLGCRRGSRLAPAG